jgi:hypothetical protein
MELEKALRIIKKGLNKSFLEAIYFKEVCKDRNLKIKDVRNLIKKNEILGIINQNKKENLFKVCFCYEYNKDLYLIIKILFNKRLRLITIFPEDSKRRKR